MKCREGELDLRLGVEGGKVAGGRAGASPIDWSSPPKSQPSQLAPGSGNRLTSTSQTSQNVDNTSAVPLRPPPVHPERTPVRPLSSSPETRSLLTALSLEQSIQPRASRSKTIQSHLRHLFESSKPFARGSAEAAQFARTVDDMVVFMKAHRLHKVTPAPHPPIRRRSLLLTARVAVLFQALVERYNPTTGLTQEERARLTMRRVGLEVPQAFSEGNTPTLEGDEARRRKAVEAEKEGKGSLQTMMGDLPFSKLE